MKIDSGCRKEAEHRPSNECNDGAQRTGVSDGAGLSSVNSGCLLPSSHINSASSGICGSVEYVFRTSVASRCEPRLSLAQACLLAGQHQLAPQTRR
jgi:hypothetical protein